MVTAILADVHANLSALEVALEDIKKRGVNRIHCLGDTFGYGARPFETLELLRRCAQFNIAGNHDIAVIKKQNTTHWKDIAKFAIDWQRIALYAQFLENVEYLEYVERAYRYVIEENTLYTHAFPSHDSNIMTNCYLLPNNHIIPQLGVGSYDLAIEALRNDDTPEPMIRRCFVGHMHVPQIVLAVDGHCASGEIIKHAQNQTEIKRKIPKDALAVICAGSVGMPRDHDNRLCYVLVDDDEISFIRLPYDIKKEGDEYHNIDHAIARLTEMPISQVRWYIDHYMQRLEAGK